MLNTKPDTKNIQLLKMLGQLRDHIDMHRIIGLNVRELQEGQISGALLGYLQQAAHESLALYISKVFEASSRNDLNSIPGIIESIPPMPVAETHALTLTDFGRKYGFDGAPVDASRNFATQSVPTATTVRASRPFRRMLSSRRCSGLPRTSTKLFRIQLSVAGLR